MADAFQPGAFQQPGFQTGAGVTPPPTPEAPRTKGVFLTNPELNIDDVVVSASSELGRRPIAIPFAANSGLLSFTPLGDPGDNVVRIVEITNTQEYPRYFPLDPVTNNPLYDNVEASSLLATVPLVSAASEPKCAVAVVEDRLYLVKADGFVLSVLVWHGTGFVQKAALTITTPSSSYFHQGGISAAAVGSGIYIAASDEVEGVVRIFYFTTKTNSISQLADSAIVTTGLSITGISLATNGSIFSLLVTRPSTGGEDVDYYFGDVNDLQKGSSTIDTLFATTWSTGGQVRAGAVTYSKLYGFVAVFLCGATGNGIVRLASTIDGENWEEFKGFSGNVAQPGNVSQPVTTTPWGNIYSCGIACEYRRVFIWRATAATRLGTPTGLVMQWFSGADGGWSAEVDADGGFSVELFTQVTATQWRGEMLFAWREDRNVEAAIIVRRGNSLTTVNTGRYRELALGEQMFVDGLDDDSQTALFFVAFGSIFAGDKFSILSTADYDYRVSHLLNDSRSRVWRGNDNATQTVVFDAGANLGFLADSFAVFGTNLPSITFQMSDDAAFASVPVNQMVSGTVKTATVLSADRNRILFANGTFEDQAYGNGIHLHWVRFSNGSVFRVLHNTTNFLIVDGNASAVSGTATVFRDAIGFLFSTVQGPYRYVRLVTPTIILPDNFYQIARVLFGIRFVPPVDYRVEWQRHHEQRMERTELKDGERYNTLLNGIQRPTWGLQFRHTLENVRPIANFFGRTRGGVQLVGFWPDPPVVTGELPYVYPMYFSQDPVELRNLEANVFELAVTIEGQI